MAPQTANPRAPINNFASLLLSKGCDTEGHGTPRVVEPRAVAKQLSKTGAEVIKIGSVEHLNEVVTNQGDVGEEADRASSSGFRHIH